MKDQKFLESWKKKRRMGFFKFCIKEGMYSWGLFSGITYYFFSSFFNGDTISLKDFVLAISIFLVIGGVLWGPLMWFYCQKHFTDLSGKDFRIDHLVKN
ncbi:MAG: hypothetical protein HQK50_05055 [Oligoflexia bacterium]|nr:hypothetical protein [Oligoflexia bacterium]MBF0364916.1 hypothetical protein [Oligoflexia bacterium]